MWAAIENNKITSKEQQRKKKELEGGHWFEWASTIHHPHQKMSSEVHWKLEETDI